MAEIIHCDYNVSVTSVPPVYDIVFTFDDIANVPFGITDPSSLAQWNAYFTSNNAYDGYTAVVVDGNSVRLSSTATSGGAQEILGNSFSLISIHDYGVFTTATGAMFNSNFILKSAIMEGLVTAGSGTFAECPMLEIINCPILESIIGTFAINGSALREFIAPELTVISGSQNFFNCGALETFNTPKLNQIGPEPASDYENFLAIFGATIDFYCRTTLTTVNGGLPTFDLETLITNNAVNLITT